MQDLENFYFTKLDLGDHICGNSWKTEYEISTAMYMQF